MPDEHYGAWFAAVCVAAWRDYAMEAHDLPHDWFRPEYASGTSPADAMDRFAAKYALDHRSEWDLSRAKRFMSRFAGGRDAAV